MTYPNVERRDSDPHAYRSHEFRCEEIEQIERENFERLLGEAGAAIRALPYDMVTNETIATILSVLSAKANQANLSETVELIDILETEIAP